MACKIASEHDPVFGDELDTFESIHSESHRVDIEAFSNSLGANDPGSSHSHHHGSQGIGSLGGNQVYLPFAGDVISLPRTRMGELHNDLRNLGTRNIHASSQLGSPSLAASLRAGIPIHRRF